MPGLAYKQQPVWAVKSKTSAKRENYERKEFINITRRMVCFVIGLACFSGVYAQESEIIVRALYRTKTSGAFGSLGDFAEIYINGIRETKQFGVYGQEDKLNVKNGINVVEIRIERDGSERAYHDRKSINIRSNNDIVTLVYGVDKNGQIEGLRIDSTVSKRSGALLESSIESLVKEMAREIEQKLPDRARLAIVNVSSADRNISELMADQIELTLISDNYYLVDRYQLDMIREEQRLQMSGEVDDDTAVSIGKLAGASVIITGSVSRTEESIRLRLRALDTETGQILSISLKRL